MCNKMGCQIPFDDDLAKEVARSIRLFKSLMFMGSVSGVGVEIVRKSAEELLSAIDKHDHALHRIHKTKLDKDKQTAIQKDAWAGYIVSSE